MIHVMLVDDHELIRIALAKVLGDSVGISVIAEAVDGEDALAKARALKPDVVLIDVDMPGMGGVEATRRLAALPHQPKVVAVSVHDQPPYPQRMMEAGAVGYLPKGGAAEEVVDAVRVVARGGAYIAPTIAGQLVMASIRQRADNPFEGLSAREMQVALMLVQGRALQEIADALSIGYKTVCTHRYRIFQKLGIDSDVKLIHLAYRYGVVDIHSP
ncbi:response regulator [Plasticicumulans acidivorans]|uniref:LuxR family two component transcriptional regulator n=1 Tax=Plasticicumulans acidivorans TaxID=886464 RepID=A0A317MT36_9GAMM|nr:response regulator [Plasticicumulans acidivorans]PWV60553.1 LuxR family two component transcriptional regulator [Plasticicumulans acidivorans]